MSNSSAADLPSSSLVSTANCDERSDSTNVTRFSLFHDRMLRVVRWTANDVDGKRQSTRLWSEMMSGGCAVQSEGRQSRRVITRPSVFPWRCVDSLTTFCVRSVWGCSFRNDSLRSTCEKIHDPLFYQLRYGKHAKFGNRISWLIVSNALL